MAAASMMQPSMSTSLVPLGMSMAPADKYRGAVVEVSRHSMQYSLKLAEKPFHPCQDLQLPPAFALPCEEPIAAAIELAYDRDFSHIP
jgi:hypothetical protein